MNTKPMATMAHSVMTIAAAIGLSICCITANAENDAPSAPPAAPTTAPDAGGDKSAPQDKPSTLDELLGIQDDGSDRGAADASAREREERLKQELSQAEIADRFVQAIQKMSISAELLDERFDPGLGTQRVQEDILAKLDQLIKSAKKNSQQSQSSSSSSSSSSQRQNASQKPPPSQSQRQNNQANPGQRNNQPSDSNEGESPPMQQGDVNTVIEESRSEWGNLPQRVRDALNQGKRDKYSSLYDKLTAEYYQRLAEEAAP